MTEDLQRHLKKHAKRKVIKILKTILCSPLLIMMLIGFVLSLPAILVLDWIDYNDFRS